MLASRLGLGRNFSSGRGDCLFLFPFSLVSSCHLPYSTPFIAPFSSLISSSLACSSLSSTHFARPSSSTQIVREMKDEGLTLSHPSLLFSPFISSPIPYAIIHHHLFPLPFSLLLLLYPRVKLIRGDHNPSFPSFQLGPLLSPLFLLTP